MLEDGSKEDLSKESNPAAQFVLRVLEMQGARSVECARAGDETSLTSTKPTTIADMLVSRPDVVSSVDTVPTSLVRESAKVCMEKMGAEPHDALEILFG